LAGFSAGAASLAGAVGTVCGAATAFSSAAGVGVVTLLVFDMMNTFQK
jgi:hypothetical protein